MMAPSFAYVLFLLVAGAIAAEETEDFFTCVPGTKGPSPGSKFAGLILSLICVYLINTILNH